MRINLDPRTIDDEDDIPDLLIDLLYRLEELDEFEIYGPEGFFGTEGWRDALGYTKEGIDIDINMVTKINAKELLLNLISRLDDLDEKGYFMSSNWRKLLGYFQLKR